MKQEEIIHLARQVLSKDIDGLWLAGTPDLEVFAQLIADKEREACWKIACEYTQLAQSHTCLAVADAIKARGKS